LRGMLSSSVPVSLSANLPCGRPTYWRSVIVADPLRNPASGWQCRCRAGFSLRITHSRRLSPWRIPCGTSNQSATVPLSANSPCRQSAYQRPLPWRTPSGMSASRQQSRPLAKSSLRRTQLIGGLSLYQRPLRSVNPGDRGAADPISLRTPGSPAIYHRSAPLAERQP